MRSKLLVLCVLCFANPTVLLGQGDEKAVLETLRNAGMQGGDPTRGKAVFESKETACLKCHQVSGDKRLAGPDLAVIGDKFSRDQLIRAVLEPSARIHPDFATVAVRTKGGRVLTGVLQKRTDDELQLLDGEGKLQRIPAVEIEEEKRSSKSLMPNDVVKTLSPQAFADLIAYLATRKQGVDQRFPGLVEQIPEIAKPVGLAPLHSDELRFDHPVWIIAVPGGKREYLVIEQMTRRIWLLSQEGRGDRLDRRELFVDLSGEASTGQFEGVMCLAFHPRYLENGKYYLNYHVREGGRFTPVIVQRQASSDRRRDSGSPSKRLLEIRQDTDLHWGGMLAFGPDGYLYIGAGDGGPQEDPEGHSQDLGLLLGSILRIDVDRVSGDLAYGIPETNPHRNQKGVRPEIWASGYRMPWRFSFDSQTGDLWVGDIGQNLFEEVSIARVGENHGWNVYEGFTRFSDQYRQSGKTYTPPIVSYRRKYGVSVTGGYVYRGKKSPTFEGAYIFGDFESKRIWALKQSGRKLIKIRQIGASPQKISSFGVDADGELFLVGYEGTIFRLSLDESTFE